MSELTDNFGSAPIDAFKGVNPEFNSQKDVYYFMLAELKDAAAKIDPSITGMTDKTKNVDIAYGMDWNKWIKYANSMRMRLAMRLSEVDAAKAKSEFEDAAKDSKFIATSADNFAVAEKRRLGRTNGGNVQIMECSDYVRNFKQPYVRTWGCEISGSVTFLFTCIC